MKRILSVVLIAVLMLAMFAGCGEETSNEDLSNGTGWITDGFVFKNDESVELGELDKKLDPSTVYSKIKYTPQMFYGDYSIRGGDEANQEFGKESKYFTWQQGGKDVEYSVLPFRFQAGPATLAHTISYVKGYNWARVYYMSKDESGECYLDTVLCAYTVESDTLKIKPIKNFKYNEADKKITYSFENIEWEYKFSFSGRSLTLTSGDESVTMQSGLDPYRETDYFCVDNYLSPDSETIGGIDLINFRYDSEDNSSYFYIELVDGTSSYNSIGVLQENGLFTFTLALEESTTTYQYVYFNCDDDGIILTDGDKVFYFNDTYADRNRVVLNEYVTDDQTGSIDDLSEAELKALVEKKENLMNDLAAAFNDAGIKVTVNQKTGELAMDSSVLFGGDSAVLTADGKALLNKFVKAYTSIVFSEKYEGFVAKTMIEGHTAPVGNSTYEMGLPLSQERAKVVKNYCVSSETGVDTTKLAKALEAIGYSNSKPIKDANGKVDMAASRRVSFRFIINIG